MTKRHRDIKRIMHGLEKAYERLIKFKKIKGTPLVVSKDGEVVEISPEHAEEDMEN
jgi:hypothetical protein